MGKSKKACYFFPLDFPLFPDDFPVCLMAIFSSFSLSVQTHHFHSLVCRKAVIALNLPCLPFA